MPKRSPSRWPERRPDVYAVSGIIAYRQLIDALDKAAGAALSLRAAHRATPAFRQDHARIMHNEGLTADDAGLLWYLFAARAFRTFVDIEETAADVLVKLKPNRTMDGLRKRAGVGERVKFCHPDLLDPLDGALAKAKATADRKKDVGELVGSMRRDGWLPGSTIVKDSRGMIISGNRRMEAIIKLRGEGVTIEPHVIVLPAVISEVANRHRNEAFFAYNRGQKAWTKGQREELSAILIAAGYTQAEAAELIGVSRQTVGNDVAGGDTNANVGKSVTPQHIARAREMREALGMKNAEIAAAFGVPIRTVQRWLNDPDKPKAQRHLQPKGNAALDSALKALTDYPDLIGRLDAGALTYPEAEVLARPSRDVLQRSLMLYRLANDPGAMAALNAAAEAVNRSKAGERPPLTVIEGGPAAGEDISPSPVNAPLTG
jgi:DNA-binding XRE family transcriptional regulator